MPLFQIFAYAYTAHSGV